MIRSSLGLRLAWNAETDPRVQLREAASWGAKGVVLDAAGPLLPRDFGETARREFRHLLRTGELALIALHLPTRRPFDREDQLDDRIARADRAFTLAYELGSRICLLNIGAIPPADAEPRRSNLKHALERLSQTADRRGLRLTIEAGEESAQDVRALLDSIPEPRPAASIDPGAFATRGEDPALAARTLGEHLAHAYATEIAGAKQSPLDRPFARQSIAQAIDWEAYLGALEEVAYRGFVTVWPEPTEDPKARFQWFSRLFARF